MTKDIQPLAQVEALLEHALDYGASAAEAILIQRQGNELVHEGRQTRVASPASTRLLGRVYLEDGRSAPFTVTSDRSKSMETAVRRAARAAVSARPRPEAGPVDRYDVVARGTGLDDPRFARIGEDDRREVAVSNYESLRADGITPLTSIYRDSRTAYAYGSTRGVSLEYHATFYEIEVEAQRSDGAWPTRRHASGRSFGNVGSLPYGTGVVRRIASLAHPRSMPPGEKAIVLPPRTLAWLVTRLAPGFSAKAVDAGKSWILRDDGVLGARRVHLTDDGSLPGGVRSRVFDHRGVPPMPVPLIREGRRGGVLLDPETARRKGLRPSGHVVDGALVPSNLVLRTGNRSRTQMLGEVPLALAFDRLEGDLNIATGEMRLKGPAVVLARGRPDGSVDEAVLEGNVVDLLKSVVELSSDQTRYGNVDCATALLKGFPIQGG